MKFVVKVNEDLYIQGATPNNSNPETHRDWFATEPEKAHQFDSAKDASFFIKGPGQRRVVKLEAANIKVERVGAFSQFRKGGWIASWTLDGRDRWKHFDFEKNAEWFAHQLRMQSLEVGEEIEYKLQRDADWQSGKVTQLEMEALEIDRRYWIGFPLVRRKAARQ